MKQEDLASKCHDIQVSLGNKEVAEFESLPQIGMIVNLALHIRGLPIIEYEKFRLVANHYFGIHPIVFRQIITHLAEIDFVKLDTEGSSIKKVLPQVPYFDNIFSKVGEYAESELKLNEPEQLALDILVKLSGSPVERSQIFEIGAEKKLVDRTLQIGEEGGYIIPKRARGKDILISPVFFSENADFFADLTAKAGAKKIQKMLGLIKKAQGWPLALIEQDMKINGIPITKEEVDLLKRLAQDGMVKPPSITTPHAGQNYFMFTPAPGNSKLNPTNKEIFERAMALISSVRQGQFLAREFRIIWPEKILNALKRNGYINSSSEALSQYHQLAILKVGRLECTSGNRYRFVLNETEENRRALNLAIELLESGELGNMEINEEAKLALQKDQTYIESLIASSKLRETEKVTLDEETKEEIDNLLIKGLA